MRFALLIVLINALLTAGLVWRLRDPRETAVLIEPPPTRTPAPTATVLRLRVHVSGAVATPGVVVLAEGARAAEAVAAAGGALGEADLDWVNLAAPLADGQQLHVPVQDEVGGGSPVAMLGLGGQGGSSGHEVGGGAGPVRVDPNRAGQAELERLPGIGPALAARIVAHREAKGRFERPEDLLAVPGIGAAKLEGMVEWLEIR